MKQLAPTTIWDLPLRHVGRRVWVYDRLDSTNSLALQLGDDPSHAGLAILAREQSAGRGQYGRTWLAPPGSSVLLSLLLAPPASLRRPALLTAWAAVSVCETIRLATGLQAAIKWPNDVLIAGRKVCGILIEQRSGTSGDVVVAGLGLNVRQPVRLFVEAGLPEAGSLFSLSQQLLETDDVARLCLSQLDEHMDTLLSGGIIVLQSRWQERLGLLGQEVAVELATQNLEGRLVTLTFAALEVETARGERVRFQPEAVRHLTVVG